MTTDGDRSSYNEAERKMDRLHQSQQRINDCRLNLLSKDISGLYYYEIMAMELLSLLAEIRGKMSKDEKVTYEQYRLDLTLFFDFKNVFESVSSAGYGKSILGTRLNKENWIELRKMLFKIEDFTRDTLDLRGFSSFNMEDDDGDSY